VFWWRANNAPMIADDSPDQPAAALRGDLVALPAAFHLSPIRGLLGSAFGAATGRFVHERGQRAYAQVIAEPGRDHWFIARLVVSRAEEGQRLLDRLAREAGLRGVIRLHTLIPEHPDLIAWWQRAGFTPFRRIHLLAGQREQLALPSQSLTIRHQQALDAWEVQRLYERVTPRPVQFAEARTRAAWHVGQRAGWRIRGYLLTADGETRAYCRVRSRAGWHIVELVAEDQAASEALAIVGAALACCARPRDQVLLLLPDEAGATRARFEQAGLTLLETRLWVARYTIRRIRAGFPIAEHARLAGLAEAPRVLYHHERPKVAVLERATRS